MYETIISHLIFATVTTICLCRSKAQSRVDEGEDNIVETKALDLSGIGAYRISSRIYDLAELTYLNLSDNHLGRISPNIQYFAK